jgi:hypothetical protein
MLKQPLVALVGLSLAASVHADVQRPQYTVENRLPKIGKLETGAQVSYQEIDYGRGQVDALSAGPYVRFGVLDNLTATARLPFVNEDSSVGGTDFGTGSLGLGLQLRAYENILGYPYVIPHVEIQIDTSSDDFVSPEGQTISTVGISIGTVVDDNVTFVADVSYVDNQDTDSGVQASLSVLWALSNQFSWITEARVADIEDGENDTPGSVLGGFSYAWTRKLFTTFHAGTGIDSSVDVIAAAKVAYIW